MSKYWAAWMVLALSNRIDFIACSLRSHIWKMRQFTPHLKRALKSVAIWKPTCVQTKWQKWWLKMVIKAALCYDYDCYCSTSSSLLYLLVFRWTVFSTFADPFWEWTEMFVSKEGSNCIVFISRAAFQGLNPNSDRLTLKIVKRELTL